MEIAFHIIQTIMVLFCGFLCLSKTSPDRDKMDRSDIILSHVWDCIVITVTVLMIFGVWTV